MLEREKAYLFRHEFARIFSFENLTFVFVLKDTDEITFSRRYHLESYSALRIVIDVSEDKPKWFSGGWLYEHGHSDWVKEMELHVHSKQDLGNLL